MKKKLKEICTGFTKNIAQKELYDINGDYEIFGASGLIKKIDYYVSEVPYIGIVKDGSGVGRVNSYPEKSSLIGTMQYIVPNDDIELNYLMYGLRSLNLGNLYRGAAIPHIYFKEYKEFELEIPSKEEQIKIAAELDTIQSAIDNKKQQLALLDEAVKSEFVEMFGENPVESGKWKVEKLGYVAEIKIGPFGSLLHKQDYIENGHCLVNPSHIKDGKIQVDYSLSVTDEKYNELKAYQLEINDIVLGRRGEMGRCAIVTDKGLLCGTGSMIVRPNGKLKSFFLNFVLSSNATKKYLEDNAIGVTMKNINEPLVKSISVPVIPLDLQNQFAAFVQKIDKSKSLVKQQIADLQELLDSKMQQYFA